MSSRERFIKICVSEMRKRGLDDEAHRKRFKDEVWEITAQGEYDYFLGLYDQGVKYEHNENNLLAVELMQLAPGFDINKPPATDIGDWPDIDVDYLKPVRDYLKNEWAPKYFGQEYVCQIGSYNTFGIKSALIDMAKVHGLERNDIIAITKNIKLKDDDGNPMTYEKALEIYKLLKEYCDQYPEVGEAARRICDRVRSRGKHAGGLIISSKRIDDFVPLVLDNDGNVTSAFTEGLNSQDLGPLGLIKFDLLVITNNEQVAKIKELIKERHPQDAHKVNWADIEYLNDPKALEIANKGLLKCIFQFDSAGIRGLVAKGGVKSFDDLVAYTSIFRPGPLESGVHNTYCDRAKGKEEYEIPDILEETLRPTYGTVIYQESCMQIANIVGGIPLKDGYGLLKAISKKKVEIFYKYKEQFIKNGQNNLGWIESKVDELWQEIEAMSGYAFNKSHAVAYTYLSSRLLYMKAHYPIEFFAGILSCETDEDKIKDYRIEAASFGVNVKPVDVNKSNVEASIVDEEIYCGFLNIKGIGRDPAKRIVDGQPYKSFDDFLVRFGTEANVLKPVIALRLFKDADPVTLFRFYEYFRIWTKKRDDRRKRYEKIQLKYKTEMDYLFETGLPGIKIASQIGELQEKAKKSKAGFEKKELHDIENPPTIEAYMTQEPDDNLYIEEKISGTLNDLDKAELEYYGFRWVSPLTLSPDYKGGMTFERLRHEAESGDVLAAPVELEIWNVKQRKSRKGTEYWQLEAQDANEEKASINVWKNDYDTWKEELDNGHLVRLRVCPPSGGFATYSMQSFRRGQKVPKSEDYRLILLRKGERKKDFKKNRPLTDKDVLTSLQEDFND